MSLKKQDPALRVAANDPHLVSLGGGRLSTAVTIHYIPIGDMTIGSESNCSISLNGSGVLPLHCTLYRSDKNEVTIVPEREARIIIDNNRITSDTNLTQGAMITIGNSNYLRFNNPAEAQLIRSTMGSNDRISMPQIDFNQEEENNTLYTSICNGDMYSSFHEFYENKIASYPKQHNNTTDELLEKIIKAEYINVNNFHSPKVFAADSITVNAPAKDVLGPKYASFAKNLVENNKNDKNTCTKNNEIKIKNSNYVNIPPSFIQNSPNACGNDVLAKVNNNNLVLRGGNNQYSSTTAPYDRYPKPGSYGGLQLFPMNGVNSEINANGPIIATDFSNLQNPPQQRESKMSPLEQERIDEILKICTEYDKQNQSITSSPIVQNRIKTNGSLPRDKKSPFHQDLSPHIQSGHQTKVFFPDKFKTNSGYENVRFIGDRRVEIGGSPLNTRKSGYENVSGKYVPQSPRTKIKTICVSAKKDSNIRNVSNGHDNVLNNSKSNEYAQLIQSFEDKLKLEIQAIQENSKIKKEKTIETALKRTNKNVNNLKLDISSTTIHEPEETTWLEKKNLESGKEHVILKDLVKNREIVLSKIRKLKTHIAEIQRQEDEVLRELDMEKALVTAELSSVKNSLNDMENNLTSLQLKFHRLEAQRNANRVMQETRQAKLKQTIEIKQEQVVRLQNYVENNPNDKTLQGERTNCIESLENDKKIFEDLEFQYLEEETEWLAYREELCNEIKQLTSDVEERRITITSLEEQGINNQNTACKDTKTLENDLLSLLTALEKNREELQHIDKQIFEISGHHQSQSDQSDDEDFNIKNKKVPNTVMSQSLFGSAEILCTKQQNEFMSRSVNENMFYNNNIEPITSTPKRILQILDLNDSTNNSLENKEKEHFDITAEIVCRENNQEKDPILKLKYNIDGKPDCRQNQGNLNLSLGSDDYEVNPLERRIPSQDDIDRICKVTTDAPISTRGASDKIFESIKEIERNRQLLLAQQGSYVIEHERQKILELKKKCHDEARAQYLSSHSDPTNSQTQTSEHKIEKMENATSSADIGKEKDESIISRQRYSHPAQLESQRPLSEGNSELSYDHLSEIPFISNTDLLSTSYNLSGNNEDTKRSSAISNETDSSDKLVSGSRRTPLQKHQRPLTRYLPIASPYLDLKLHIESSGHQLALCPHVFVDSYSCRGYLHKLGSTFHAWSRRWFILDRQRRAFIYYADKTEKKPRGGACFPSIDEVYLDHFNTSKSGRPSCTFIVKTKKRSYNLQAASDAAARIWIDAIITGAHGNTEYD